MGEQETFGQVLKRLRNAKGWTLRQAADALKINFAYLSQLEAGVTKPSEELARRIAETFGEDVERVMFLARNVPAQIEDIMKKYPTASKPFFTPSHFRRVSGGDDKKSDETK